MNIELKSSKRSSKTMPQMKDVNKKQISQDQAFDALERIIKVAPELDDEKELASWRDDRYAQNTLKEIQALFETDKGWNSEEEMIVDIAKFRRPNH